MTLHTHAFPPEHLRASVSTALPLRDQPWEALSGGRVNRLWRVGDTVVKLFQPNGESPLFPNDRQAETLALEALAGMGLAPILTAQGPDWVAYRYVPGAIWRKDPRLVARTLTALHQRANLNLPAFRKGANGSAALLAQAKAIAALCNAKLPHPPQDPSMPPGPACLIHGDAVPGNMIEAEDRLTLIDWQCPALGDATEDLATFLSPAMQWLYRGRVLDAADTASFLDACPRPTADRYRHLAPLYHWRMAAHCLWKAEQGDADYATALTLELAAL